MKKFTLAVAVPKFGEPSQTWVYRQLSSFDRLRTRLVHWGPAKNFSAQRPNLDAVDLSDGADPIFNKNWSKWLDRASHLRDQNFFAPNRRSQAHLKRAFSNIRPDAILCHFGHTALHVLPIADHLQVPLIAHFHGVDLSESFQRNRWYRWSLQKNLRRFRSCVVVGSHQRDVLLELGYPEERIHLIPCGVPTELFKPSDAGFDRRLRFVSVSRLVRNKGVHISLRAFAILAERYPDAEYWIIGDGPEKGMLTDLRNELCLNEKVKFLGNLDELSVMEKLTKCNIFLQHSLQVHGSIEGFGVSVSEASSCCLPVIVTPVGGLTDQVVDGETGLIVPEGDPNAMAAAMCRLSSDTKLMKQMGESGRKRMRLFYDYKNLGRQLEDVILSDVKAGYRNVALETKQ
ncbi:glycosyltransferase [Boseongicola aestuarii]|uniref:GDP-mannose-dependent alpha-(1-6)-phosphatidylinositol monomannoside mannosyltransferase n=1 Tax=Boseongicola aestuarii TaxID=1470561 RepID=A0A238J260_9RHOB|nr:glycosyltransferase [Boseongicola aestuarii]SMX24255.1 GDP-mannose-dependent alpha-(1-6)-phosphatidylinositol monomannoside mannosyltransferase [Boseongicola aestuarii]